MRVCGDHLGRCEDHVRLREDRVRLCEDHIPYIKKKDAEK